MGRTRQALVAVAFTLVSCSSQILPAATPTSQDSTLRLYATTATIPLMNNLTTTYNRLNGHITFETGSGNYALMADRLMRGEIPYFLSNHLPPEEDVALWAAPIGQDGIAIITHPDNPVSGLTSAQLRDIYQGWINNWSEVGGPPQEIVVVTREDGSGTRAEFDNLLMGRRRTTPSAQIAPSSAAMVLTVARQPGAIGYVSMSYLNNTVRTLALDGLEPTLENVYANRYPLRSTLFVVGLQEPQGDFRAFIGWVQSPEGQLVVGRNYAPLLRP